MEIKREPNVKAAKARRRADTLAEYDEQLRRAAGGVIAGVDEAGRGCLAGPVVAAAVILPPGAWIEGVDDSKALTREAREEARRKIEAQALSYAVGWCDPEEIDRVNILNATLLAACQAVRRLAPKPIFLITDYLKVDIEDTICRPEVKADGKSLCVAAASIIAKTTRDRAMAAYSAEYPGYGLESNKGYGSPAHLQALEAHGPSTLHRLTFGGVSLFTERLRTSVSFDRLRALRGEAAREWFQSAARQLLERAESPLVERERRRVRRWLKEQAAAQ